jgi:alpha-galactosidase
LKRLFRFCAFSAAVCVCAAVPAAAQAPVVASLNDAFISHDSSSDFWTIGAKGLQLVVGFDENHILTLQSLSDPTSGRSLNILPAPPVSFTAGGSHVVLTKSGDVTLSSATATSDAFGVYLGFTFEDSLRHLRIVRNYACYPGSPTVETWTHIESLIVQAMPITDIVAWQITLPVDTVYWLGGLRGDAPDAANSGAFELSVRDLDVGDHLEIGGANRSTEQDVPFFMVGNGADDFYGGIEWSGGWRTSFDRLNDTDLRVTALFPDVTTTIYPTHPLDIPHAFFGIGSAFAGDESGAMLPFIMNGIRRGRPFQPMVTYNTWFAYGTAIDQDLLATEMEREAAMGVELFVVDAGWYKGAGAQGQFDFTSGLGTWAEDTARFPDHLSALAQNAHGANMKFGIWVEPERAALSTVNVGDGVQESWLAQHDGSYGTADAAQICLVHPGARKWVMDHLTALIDSTHADYLKWDNNLWINCNRPGHGHGHDDGNLQHVQALYGILAELRQRYPNLIIENVSGGGNRLDFGMLAYTDTAWMDDRSSPSDHVRHNLEGLTFAFPPAYLLSFVIDSEEDPIRGSLDFPLVARSRMPGIFGLTYRTTDFDDTLTNNITQSIASYKSVRDIIATANATLLSDQAPIDPSSWEVLQEVSGDSLSMIVFAYKGDDTDGHIVVKPKLLVPDATYRVRSVDMGDMGSATGADLMADGFELDHIYGMSRAHIVVLQADGAAAKTKRKRR